MVNKSPWMCDGSNCLVNWKVQNYLSHIAHDNTVFLKCIFQWGIFVALITNANFKSFSNLARFTNVTQLIHVILLTLTHFILSQFFLNLFIQSDFLYLWSYFQNCQILLKWYPVWNGLITVVYMWLLSPVSEWIVGSSVKPSLGCQIGRQLVACNNNDDRK